MKNKNDGEKKSILPLSGREENVRMRAVKTTIVGGQPPGNERPLQNIPVGIEQLLAMAAVDDEFAAAMLEDLDSAVIASGVELTVTEKGILASIPAPALRQMIDNVRGRIPAQERRAFLKKSAAALLALVSGGFLTTAALAEDAPAAPGGVRAEPRTTGIKPDRPDTKGVRPDRPQQAAKRSSIPTWTETIGKVPEKTEDDKKPTVFDYFSRVAVNRNAAPFLIYFYVRGTDEKDAKVKKCIKFEKALDEASDLRKAAMDFGRYVCDASKLDEKITKKFSVKTPGIIIFDGTGKKVHTITSIPKKAESLIKKLKKIKEASDKACGIEPKPKPQPSPASRGHRADRPEKK